MTTINSSSLLALLSDNQNQNQQQSTQQISSNGINDDDINSFFFDDLFPAASPPQVQVPSMPFGLSSSFNPASTIPTQKTFETAATTSVQQIFSCNINKQQTCKIQQAQQLRTWRVAHFNSSLVNDAASSFRIKVKTRSDKQTPADQVSERLYASIKYEITHIIDIKSLATNPLPPFLLARLSVIDAETGELVQKINNGDVKEGEVNKTLDANNSCSILDGQVERSLAQKVQTYEETMKVKFTDVSYHHCKKMFKFAVNYYLNTDLETPICVMHSASFLVLARKPKKKKNNKKNSAAAPAKRNTKKRKQQQDDDDDDEEDDDDQYEEPKAKPAVDQPPAAKRAKASNNYEEFVDGFQQLLNKKYETLGIDEKKFAIDMMMRCLMEKNIQHQQQMADMFDPFAQLRDTLQ